MAKKKKSVQTELKKIEKKEESIEKEIHALRKEIKGGVIEKFTYKDIARGVVGAIFGMSIMGWHETVRSAAMSMPWANVLIMVLLTFVGGASVLYFSQYRRIEEKWIIHHLLPRRFVIFYALSLLIVFFIYLLFGFVKIGITPIAQIIKLVLVVSLPAMIGASAADIIR